MTEAELLAWARTRGAMLIARLKVLAHRGEML